MFTTCRPGGYLYFEASSIPSGFIWSDDRFSQKLLKSNQLTIFDVGKFHYCRHPDCNGDDLAESPYFRDHFIAGEKAVYVDVISKAYRPDKDE